MPPGLLLASTAPRVTPRLPVREANRPWFRHPKQLRAPAQQPVRTMKSHPITIWTKPALQSSHTSHSCCVLTHIFTKPSFCARLYRKNGEQEAGGRKPKGQTPDKKQWVCLCTWPGACGGLCVHLLAGSIYPGSCAPEEQGSCYVDCGTFKVAHVTDASQGVRADEMSLGLVSSGPTRTLKMDGLAVTTNPTTTLTKT